MFGTIIVYTMDILIDIVRNTNFLSKEVKEMIFDMFFECVDL